MSISVEFEGREVLDDFHGLDADGGDAFDQYNNVARIVVFESPVVGVVDDAGGFVGFDLVAVEDPVQCGSGAEDVFVCLVRNSRDS